MRVKYSRVPSAAGALPHVANRGTEGGATVPSNEIELKLAVPQEKVARLRRSPLLRSLARGRAASQRLKSVYFDTPDLKLQRHGLALRIREVGAKRIQTLKVPAPTAAGLQSYREFEADLEADRPDLSLIGDEGLQDFFRTNAIAADLVPVFETEFDRRVVPLRMIDTDVELAVDVGEIKSGARRMALCEAELELQSGRPGRLFELALALHGTIPLTLEQRTKAARGYSLFVDTVPTPVRARPVELDPSVRGRDAFVDIARNCIGQVRGNEICVDHGEDPEGVHQMRVGVRRLRSLVGAYRPYLAADVHAFLSGELRWLQQQLAPARDWDVFVTETVLPLRGRLPDDLALEALRRESEALRRSAYEQARGTLADPRYTELVLRLELLLDAGGWSAPDLGEGRLLDRPAGEFAAELLQRRHKRLRKLGGKHGDLSESGLHKVRLLGKKLRYHGEFFRSLYPRKPTRRYLAALTEIQEPLGSLNDAVVTRHLLSELEQRLGENAPALATRAVGIVIGWQAARIERDLGHFRAVWESFVEQKPFWAAD